MEQKRNFVVFLVAAVAILLGWFWLQGKIWPPRPADPKKGPDNLKVDWVKVGPAQRAAHLTAAPTLPLGGLGWPLLAVGAELVQPPPIRYTQFRDIHPDYRLALAMLPPPPLTVWPALSQMLAHAPARPTPSTPEAKVVVKSLGGPKHFIRADLTTRGAGVQKLTLPLFKAANYLGRPTKKELELIGDDPMVASYLMFHYPKTDEVKPVPVTTLGERVWEVDEPTEDAAGVQQVRFHTTIPDPGFEHLKITKTYRLEPKAYHLGLNLEIEDTRPKTEGAESTKFRYQLTGAHGMPVEGGWYATTYRQALIGTVNDRNDLWRDYQDSMAISHTQGGYRVPEGQRGDSFLQYAAVATQFFASAIVVDNEQPSRAAGGADMRTILAWARPTLESQEVPAKVQNIDVANNHLFVSQAGDQLVLYHLLPRVMDHLKELGILQADKEGKDWTVKKGAPLVVSYYNNGKNQKVATWVREGQTPRGYFDDITVRVNSEKIELKPSEKVIHQFLLYHGPVKTRLLTQFPSDQAVSAELDNRYTHTLHLRTLTDYRSPGPFGAISQKIMFTDLLILVTNLMHTLLYWLHFLVGGYGLAIILLTVIVRGLMFPISRKQALFAQKMQELAPELKKIQEKYKGDARARTEATMEFYRKNRINPLGSCLPLLMQMPIFLGLYFALQESIHFRLAGFLWVENLAAPDMFLYWTQSIPWLSDPDNLGGIGYLGPYLNVLPLVAVFLMIAQQKLMTPPAQDEQQAAQQRMMRWMMILFGVMFYKVAAGLCIYFIVSSLWGVTERKLLPKKQLAAAGPTPSGQTPNSLPGGPKGKNPKLPPKPPETGFWAWLKNKWSEIQKSAEKK